MEPMKPMTGLVNSWTVGSEKEEDVMRSREKKDILKALKANTLIFGLTEGKGIWEKVKVN